MAPCHRPLSIPSRLSTGCLAGSDNGANGQHVRAQHRISRLLNANANNSNCPPVPRCPFVGTKKTVSSRRAVSCLQSACGHGNLRSLLPCPAQSKAKCKPARSRKVRKGKKVQLCRDSIMDSGEIEGENSGISKGGIRRPSQETDTREPRVVSALGILAVVDAG